MQIRFSRVRSDVLQFRRFYSSPVLPAPALVKSAPLSSPTTASQQSPSHSLALPLPLPHFHRDNFFSSSSIFDLVTDLFGLETNRKRRWQELVEKYAYSIQMDQDREAVDLLLKMNDFIRTDDGSSEHFFFQYAECLQIWLKFFARDESAGTFVDLVRVVGEYDNLLLKSGFTARIESLQTEVLKAVMRCYCKAKLAKKSALHLRPMKEFFIKYMEKYKIDFDQFNAGLDLTELLSIFEEISGAKSTLTQNTQEALTTTILTHPSLSIEPYCEESGDLHFDRVCDYIADTKFKWKNRPIDVPLFCFYDTLEYKKEKDEFMASYIQFNKIRQENLDKYSHRIVKSVVPSASIHSKQKFSKELQSLIRRWVRDTTKFLELKLGHEVGLKEEQSLNKFESYFKILPLETMVSQFIQMLIGYSESNEIELYRLILEWKQRVLSQSVTLDPKNFKRSLFKFVLDDAFIELSQTLVSAIMQCCHFRVAENDLNAIAEEIQEDGGNLAGVMVPFAIESMQKLKGNPAPGLYRAFTDILKSNKKHAKVRFILINPVLSKSVKLGSTFGDQHFFPLLCPPQPWLGHSTGGMMNSAINFVAGFDKLHQRFLQKAQLQGKLDRAFLCLDQMGKTGWCVNTDILDVFNKAMDLPSGLLKIPPPLDTMPTKPKDQTARDVRNQRKIYETIKAVANAYGVNGDILFHCYLFDFRGRAYALSQINHYGEDIMRSLFQFWEAKPLGERGFYWLKYQLASLFKPGKETSCEEFFEKHKNNILQAASNPLDDEALRRWWLQADKPFQFLATCMEVAKVLKHLGNGNNVATFICRMPIHQDGSCNGLQHYAGLARDDLGGRSVNLLPLETKMDVYVEVRDLVEKKIRNDIGTQLAAPEEVAKAKLILQILDRKLVKRPVMTTVYGVTRYGASEQIYSRIKEMINGIEQNPAKSSADDVLLSRLKTFQQRDATYLVEKIFAAIDELFKNAKRIETWLTHTANRINTSYNVKTLDYLYRLKRSLKDTYITNPVNLAPISWISVSGFPVIQVYRDMPKVQTQGVLGSTSRDASENFAPMDRKKHELAIAPNFIHSLDASHMAMTCAAAAAENPSLVFASIHDSYWTHACDVDRLSVILREQFVEMYSFDYMEVVKRDFERQVRNSYQMVYFEKKGNHELYRKVKDFRKKYGESKIKHQLEIELRELGKVGYQNHTILMLIEENMPDLYYVLGKKNFLYSSAFPKEVNHEITDKVPVFVPVKIPDLPKKGDLDIEQVLESKYFFS